MKTVAVICNVVFWGFICMVMVTDGPPEGSDILLSLLPFLMPILNVVVMRALSSPGRVITLVALLGNIAWLGIACWMLIERYPSHPSEVGLLAYAVLMALTPLLSALAIGPHLRAPKPAPPM